MIYLINIENPGMYNTIYTLFETHTESTMEVTEGYIKTIINAYGMSIKNGSLVGGKIEVKPWPHNINYDKLNMNNRNNYILLTKIDNDKFKLVTHEGAVIFMRENALRSTIEAGEVANCKYKTVKELVEEEGIVTETDRPEYKSIDTYTLKKDIEFEKHIASKYEEFRAKLMILGIDVNFKYAIENREVKILRYTGKSKKVSLPNFVHTICAGAFKCTNIEEIKLNSKLKYIGKGAFERNRIQHIVIPESVQILHRYAFKGNKELYTEGDDFNTETVKILNHKIKLI